jgi:Ni,Fe-hydrogenase I small subunit
MDLLSSIRTGEQPLDILCLEGAVLRGPHGSGRFHVLAGSETPMAQVIAKMAEAASYVVAIGSCAAYGGVTAAGDNVPEACGLAFVGRELGGLLGACPSNGGWRQGGE